MYNRILLFLFPVFIIANSLHSMDAWICRKTNGDPCDQSSSSGQINIGINVQDYDPWTQATATPGSLPNNQQYKHVYSRSERLAIAFRVLYEEEVRKDKENELATQKELSEKLLDKEHYLKKQAKRLREIETQIVIQEGLKKLHAIHNLNLDESEIQTVNANLNMENPLGSYWLKELDSDMRSQNNREQKFQVRINKALKLLYENQSNIEVKEKAKYLIKTLIDVDQLSSKPNYQVYSQRLLKRSEELYRSLKPNKSLHLSTQESLSPEAAKLFSLDTVDSTTFTGKEIITIANTAVSILPAADSELFRFHLTAALQQANTNSAEGHWRSALNNIDRAWNLIDYSKGLVAGLYEFGTDTANGLIDLVTHPLDSVEALYESIMNYDRSYNLIKSSLEKIWDKYDTYSTKDKGRLHARIAGEILSSILPIGTLKNAAKIAKISKAVEQFSEKITILKAHRMVVADWLKLSGLLRSATMGKGNFGIGSASLEQATAIGYAWVGDGYKIAGDGKILISKDGLKQYRMPSEKPNSIHAETGFQANYESRVKASGEWQTNAHLDIME